MLSRMPSAVLGVHSETFGKLTEPERRPIRPSEIFVCSRSFMKKSWLKLRSLKCRFKGLIEPGSQAYPAIGKMELTAISRHVAKRPEWVPISFWVNPVLAISGGISDPCNLLTRLASPRRCRA